MAIITAVADSVQRQWDDTGAWVGGSVPSSSDIAVIPANADVLSDNGDFSNMHDITCPVVVDGGLLTLENGAYLYYPVTVRNGGAFYLGNFGGTCYAMEAATLLIQDGGEIMVGNGTVYCTTVVGSGGLLSINLATFDLSPLIESGGVMSSNPAYNNSAGSVAAIGASGDRTLGVIHSSDLPAVGDVAAGTIYAGGQMTGTLVVPSGSGGGSSVQRIGIGA